MIPSRINNEDEDVMQFPIDDISEELIRPFVMRERGEIVIPQGGGVINNRKYWFHNHHHELSLISLEENDDSDDDNDHPYNRRKSELICDGCITPIYPKKAHESSSSSSSSSDKHNYYCMSCSDCKYFLHLACFHSPSELPSLPLLHQYDHKLILKTFPKLEFSETRCSVCHLSTNGLLYACTECDFMADIKCASMPDTIKHTAHQRHHHRLKLVNNEPEEADYAFKLGLCGACGGEIHLYNAFYRCDSCEFNLHIQCVLLPATKKLRAWDKHMLPLTYDANINHPGEFYCDICEKGMNPKEWMYHCRECDHSFHLNCLPTTSGRYRNIKLGQQCVINHQFDHYFTFQVITTKRRCDTCPSPVYGKLGFQCALCNFAMCFEPCSRKHIDGIEIID